ncbi:MAG: lipase family protein [Chitinophagaceae bacterium]|nr:lipase family protein [Chitinophagaceae bacterium]
MKKYSLLSSIFLLVVSVMPGFSQSGTNCFNTQFNRNSTSYNAVNAYLLSYLTTMSTPDYLRFREPAPYPSENSNWVKYFQHRNDTFVRKFSQQVSYLFYNPSQQLQESLAGVQNKVIPNVITKSINKTESEPNVVVTAGGNVIFDFQYRCSPNAYDPEAIIISTPTTVYVVFRATDRVSCISENSPINSFGYNWGEWIGTDFKFLKRTWPKINGQVHRGFIESLNYENFADSVASRIKNRYGGAGKKVWIAGHSLGGAHAQLFALLLKLNWGITAQGVYVYESPHPGDVDFVNQLNSELGGKSRIQRFEFSDDPIPTLPFQMPPFSFARAGERNYFADLNKMNRGEEQIPVWDDMRLACGLLNLGLSSTIKLEALYSCGGAFCYHHPTWVLKGLRNKLPSSAYSSLPPDIPLPAQGEGTCSAPQIQKGNLNNPLVNTMDDIENAVANFINAATNYTSNMLGTVPGVTDGASYKISCYGFSRNNTKKYLNWNATDKSQLQISTTGTVFKLTHKLAGGYYLTVGQTKMVADIKEPNLGGPDARSTPNVLMQKAGNYPFGAFGDEDTWYLIPIKQNAYVLYNFNTHCILTAGAECLSGGKCGVTNIPGQKPNRYQVWLLEKQ